MARISFIGGLIHDKFILGHFIMNECDFDDPIEVWLAAEGDSSALVVVLSSNLVLSRRMRDALAAWLSGAFDAEPTIRRNHDPPPLTPDSIRLLNAAEDYLRVADWVAERGFDIDANSLLTQVAQMWHLSTPTLNAAVANLRRTGRRNPLRIEAQAFRNWQQQGRPGKGRTKV
ncbi:hypothetical protein [Rhodovulum strictum]|uniref:Uncharacterized protein n=1 Tax=Rhodovulum strictum TaxID=58314 RepID=A0A844BF43_9RHOB|nr:hypothetical protein [Rhodovulum strictum]MRH21219.1 hypothetical protein [Rhodovulum strictum]